MARAGDDRARLFERHRAGPREMPQGRSVEALQHDAEAPVQRQLAEYRRHRDAGGAHGADHAYLVPAEQMRDADLKQLHDLTGRPSVGFGRRRLHRSFPPAIPACPFSVVQMKHRRRAKRNRSHRGAAGHYDMIAFQPAETFVHSAKWSQVRLCDPSRRFAERQDTSGDKLNPKPSAQAHTGAFDLGCVKTRILANSRESDSQMRRRRRVRATGPGVHSPARLR
ncbi:hypothetical protein ACVWYH_007846 [Bradyrhizobium sp. GM24.11]